MEDIECRIVCTRCRRQSGASFSVNLLIAPAAMTVEGELAAFQDLAAESGRPVARQFCAVCGSPIRSVLGTTPPTQ